MERSRIEHEGNTYYTVAGAAKALRTNTARVKQLMGDGSLEWMNLRVNGRLYISATSIVAYQQKLLRQKRAAYAAAKAKN